MVQSRNKKQKIEKTVIKNKKSIKFNNIKYIYYTYASTEYDRTSIKIGDDFNDNIDGIVNDTFDNIDILKNISDIKYEIDLLTYFKNN